MKKIPEILFDKDTKFFARFKGMFPQKEVLQLTRWLGEINLVATLYVFPVRDEVEISL